jgi:hypothetical protein
MSTEQGNFSKTFGGKLRGKKGEWIFPPLAENLALA